MSVDDYLKARSSLTLRQLIAFQSAVFQVLPLPPRCLPPEASQENIQHFARLKALQAQEIALKSAGPDSEPRSVAEILKRLGERL